MIVFLRAFAAAVKRGAPIQCKILDRGPDRDVARRLIETLDVADHCEWLPPLSPAQLPRFMSQVDVVVDQFDVGGFGGIALEAMACGKPVITYLEKNCAELIYDEYPPILNCRTEAEILDIILHACDLANLQAIGARAKLWVFANHAFGRNLDEFICRMCLAAGMPWPRCHDS